MAKLLYVWFLSVTRAALIVEWSKAMKLGVHRILPLPVTYELELYPATPQYIVYKSYNERNTQGISVRSGYRVSETPMHVDATQIWGIVKRRYCDYDKS